ncbi:D-aspartate oxidase isoform X3 [Falco naumanni]|uniref:D-aspartate oxidase isoform X3 n=2 Tax=Falco naumanni TaxID=148594 RepID=UPI001ADE6D88|nr:D-aspartate oxidase isoform X3 [Falco naumanni]
MTILPRNCPAAAQDTMYVQGKFIHRCAQRNLSRLASTKCLLITDVFQTVIHQLHAAGVVSIGMGLQDVPASAARWQVFKNTPKEELPFWSDVVLGFRPMSKAELQKFPQHQFGQAFTTLKCDCPPYLLWLEKRLKATGVQMYTRKVADLWELHSEYNVVVNCAGIGAHQLVGDKELFPVRGQVLKVHAPWVKNFIRNGDGLTYIYPGIHRVTLGGTREVESWSLSPDPGTTKDIFDRCCSLEPSLQRAQDIKVKVGLRPSRWCVRLEREVLSQGGVKLPVVHNYGHGAGGFSVHRGTAKEAACLVGECIAALQVSSSKAKL